MGKENDTINKAEAIVMRKEARDLDQMRKDLESAGTIFEQELHIGRIEQEKERLSNERTTNTT